MGDALTIASVTAVLKMELENGLIAYADRIGEVPVNVLSPDRISIQEEAQKSHLNLFMYRVAPSPSREAPRISNPSNGQSHNSRLVIDLYYLLAAYGAKDLHAEMLLGIAMKLLLEAPRISEDKIVNALNPTLSKKAKVNSVSQMSKSLDIAMADNQPQSIKITPCFLSFEEMSKLWSALQSRYRPSMVYQVSAVVINADKII